MTGKGECGRLAEWPCVAPHFLFFYTCLLLLLYKAAFADVLSKLIAFPDCSPDNQNRTMPDPDKEVQKIFYFFYLLMMPSLAHSSLNMLS